jgi:hypothetical protein
MDVINIPMPEDSPAQPIRVDARLLDRRRYGVPEPGRNLNGAVRGMRERRQAAGL